MTMKFYQTKQFRIGVLIFLFVTLLGIAFGVSQYIKAQNEILEEERLFVEEQERIETEKLNSSRESFDIILEGSMIMFEENVRLTYADPGYYKVLGDAKSEREVKDRWNAILQAELRTVEFAQEDINGISSKCIVHKICANDAKSFISNIKRTLKLHEDYLRAWDSNDPYTGNELLSESHEYLENSKEDFSKIYLNYYSKLSQDQVNQRNSIADNSENEILSKYQSILTYCDLVDPQFHNYAMYKETCASSNASNFIELNNKKTYYYDAPIEFTGKVSSNTQKIVVTAKFGTTEDVYTLANYSAGDTTFSYKADTNWESGDSANLAEGTNTYYFVAYFEDGKTDTSEITIYYNSTLFQF